MPQANPTSDAPPFHSNDKSIPFHLGPYGHFSSGCFRVDITAMLGFSLLPGSFLPLIFLLYILHHNILSETAVTVFLKTDLVRTPVFVTYSRYLEPIE